MKRTNHDGRSSEAHNIVDRRIVSLLLSALFESQRDSDNIFLLRVFHRILEGLIYGSMYPIKIMKEKGIVLLVDLDQQRHVYFDLSIYRYRGPKPQGCHEFGELGFILPSDDLEDVLRKNIEPISVGDGDVVDVKVMSALIA